MFHWLYYGHTRRREFLGVHGWYWESYSSYCLDCCPEAIGDEKIGDPGTVERLVDVLREH